MNRERTIPGKRQRAQYKDARDTGLCDPIRVEYTSIVEIGIEAVEWRSQGDEWLHRAGECMADIEGYAITGYKYDVTTAPFFEVSNNVTDRGSGGTCFLVLPLDAGVLIATGTRGDEGPDESATEAWAHAARCATQRLGSRGTAYEWTALLGAPSIRIGGTEVALDGTAEIGPFRIASAGQPLREMVPSQIPPLLSAGLSVSWPILVEGTHEGYNWPAASKKAAFDLHRLSGLLTVASHTIGFLVSVGNPGQVSYDLGGHYTSLNVDFATGDKGSLNPVHFDILGNGNSLLPGGVDVTSAAPTVPKTVTVTGIHQLILTASTTTGSSQALFGNAEVLPSSGTPIETTLAPSSLASRPEWLDATNPSGGHLDYPSSNYPPPYTVSGHALPHTIGFLVSVGNPGQVSYDLGGHYTSLNVDFATGDKGSLNPVHFDILGNGAILLSGGVDVTPAAPTVPKTVTVTGIHQLILTASTTTGSSQALFGNAEVLP